MAQKVIFENRHSPDPPDSESNFPSPRQQMIMLDKLASESEEVIYSCSSVWPLDLFPDKIIIDENKVTIIQRMFLFKRTFPVPVKDIQTVKTIQGIVFSSLEIEVKGYEENPPAVAHLWPGHATKAREYILGLVEARREGVDLTVVATNRSRKRLRKIGSTHTE